jgi:hypothetical protein
MENKKNQISKNVKTMVDIRILEGTRDLRNLTYENIGYTVIARMSYKLYYVKWPSCHALPYLVLPYFTLTPLPYYAKNIHFYYIDCLRSFMA